MYLPKSIFLAPAGTDLGVKLLTPKGMELTEEAFQSVNVQDFKVHLTENENEHTAIVSKKSTSHREYSVNIPKSDTWGQDLGSAHVDFQRRKRSPVNTQD
jgi:hypothetical protein